MWPWKNVLVSKNVCVGRHDLKGYDYCTMCGMPLQLYRRCQKGHQVQAKHVFCPLDGTPLTGEPRPA
jgi:hypothetical protein